MRNTFAAAAIASCATALDAMAVPDFVAGFVYGMTGDNHLSEIQACYNGGTDVVSDVQKAVTLVQSGSYIKGFGEIGVIINEFPATLTTCQNMDDDIAAIEDWASIFTRPSELAETLGKNWLLHRRTIKDDLSKEEADWDSGNYFSAGVDTALALSEAVGPIQSSNAPGVDLLMVPELIAGFIYGITGDMKLAEIEKCYQSSESLAQYAEKFIGDLKQVHLLKAFWQLQLFIGNLQPVVQQCSDLGTDLKKIESWASIFERPAELGENVTFNYLMHKKAVKEDIAKEEADWANKSYFDAGKDIADLSMLLTAAPATQQEVAVVPENIDVHMVNYVLAGFIYGMTEENHLTEIEACYGGSKDIKREITTAIAEFKAGGWNNITQGVLNVLLAALQIPQELSACKVGDDITAIEDWAQVFTNKTKLISTVSKHYLFHKSEVQADLTKLEADYAAAEFFHTGEDIADLMTILVGPIKK